ncbi:MAG: hypothetical protein ABGX85_05630 [Candidatus Lambdaproteobacteria bacterium]
MSKESADIPERVVKLKPDWVLFSASAFETPELCLNLLQEVQNISRKNLRFVLAIDEINPGLTILLKLQPVFELVNKMQFKISDPDLLLTHHIRSFPRIRLGNDFRTLDYTDNSGTLVRQSPSEVPLNTLIPFKNIQKIETRKAGTAPEKWLNNFLLERDSVAHPDQVVGILRETKGCYLFPGIPFNSILSLKIDKTKIEHVIRLDECSIKNPPFKRFIENMEQEHRLWLSADKERAIRASVHIHCSCKYPIINTLMQKLLKEIGYNNFKIITEINNKELKQKKPDIYLKLNNFPADKIRQKHIDWSKDLNQILEPLNHFIYLSDLRMGNISVALPIHKIEFEEFRDKLLKEIKDAETKNQQAQSDQMLHTQERNILKKITPFSRKLLESLSASRTWESAVELASKIKQPRAILFCKNENVAAELNLSLTEVPRKLWINPFKFQHAEDLTQLNSKMTHSYLKPGTIIISASARTHLENLCRKAILESKQAETVLHEQKLYIKKIKANLELLQNKKNKSAFRWLHVSLKQLLYRDRHLFQIPQGKTE